MSHRISAKRWSGALISKTESGALKGEVEPQLRDALRKHDWSPRSLLCRFCKGPMCLMRWHAYDEDALAQQILPATAAKRRNESCHWITVEMILPAKRYDGHCWREETDAKSLEEENDDVTGKKTSSWLWEVVLYGSSLDRATVPLGRVVQLGSSWTIVLKKSKESIHPIGLRRVGDMPPLLSQDESKSAPWKLPENGIEKGVVLRQRYEC